MKSKLKALAALVALAAAGGQAGAAIHAGDNGERFLTMVVSSGNPISYTRNPGLIADSSGTADESSFPLPETEAFALGGDNAFHAKPSRQASLYRFDAVGVRLSAFPAANGSSGAEGSVAATQIPQGRGSAATNPKPRVDGRLSAPAAASVPEPGSWAIFLAGVLGVGAIARRRMSS
jgi:hypothetical protein